MRVLRVDLREIFPVEAPGSYRLEVSSDDLKTAEGEPARVFGQFVVARRDADAGSGRP